MKKLVLAFVLNPFFMFACSVAIFVLLNPESSRAAEPEVPPNTISRTWRDDTGKFSVVARMTSQEKNSVVLQTGAGKTISVSKKRLSAADRAWIAQQERIDSTIGDSGLDRGLEGAVRYTQNPLLSFVWGVGDHRWFESAEQVPDEKDALEAMMQRYNIRKIPRNTRVVVLERREHPRNGSWLYLVKYDSHKLWVLEGDLGSRPNEVKDLLSPKASEPTVVTKDRTKLTQPKAGMYKFVDDDVYPEVFGFKSLDGIAEFWSGRIDSNPSSEKMQRLGIVTIPVKTKVEILGSHMLSNGLMAYEVIPTSSVAKGKKLYVIKMDLYDDRDAD